MISTAYVPVIAAIWLAWLVSWNVATFWRERSVAEAPRNEWRLLFVLVVLGFFLTFGVFGWLFPPMWRAGPGLGWSMVALNVLGLAYTWWARIHMGRLWHAGVSRTAQHRVIDSGPFAQVRHPIYSGMMLAVWATAVLQARPLAFLGAVIFTLGFGLKARVEERFLMRELPEYPEYRKRVRMLVPFVI